MTTELLSADKPAVKDELKRRAFADRIAEMLATRKEPSSLVVGVYGQWGEGKSTVLGFITEYLEARHKDDVVVVPFNAWLFTSETELFVWFFAQLSAALGKHAKGWSKAAADAVSTLGDLVSLIPGAGGAGGAVKDVSKKLAAASPDQLRSRVEAQLAAEKKRVVVLVDDMDRLDDEQVQAVFRLLKVVANFEWTSYVVACDDQVIAEMVGERFGKSKERGREFLEKVVQVPLLIPRAPAHVLYGMFLQELNSLLEEANLALPEDEDYRFGQLAFGGFSNDFSNPRQVARCMNAIRFGLPLVRDEVNLVDWLVLETVRVLKPQLFDFIASNVAVLVQGAHSPHFELEAFKSARDEFFGTEARLRIEYSFVHDLFPRSADLENSRIFPSEAEPTWRTAMRICSPTYYPRYFAHGPTAGDVPDRIVSSVLAQQSAADMQTLLKPWFQQDDLAARMYTKLKHASWSSSILIQRQLAEALLPLGAQLPHPSPAYPIWAGIKGSAAFLVARGLRSDPVLAERLLRDIEITFAIMVARDLREEGDDAKFEAVRSTLCSRAREKMLHDWPFDSDYPAARLSLSFLYWAESRADFGEFVEAALTTDKRRSLDVLDFFSQSSWSLETGRRSWNSALPETVARLDATFGTQRLADVISEAYPNLVPKSNEQDLDDDDELDSLPALARSFLRAVAEPPPTEFVNPETGSEE